MIKVNNKVVFFSLSRNFLKEIENKFNMYMSGILQGKIGGHKKLYLSFHDIKFTQTPVTLEFKIKEVLNLISAPPRSTQHEQKTIRFTLAV